jgi:hypothetical protein
MQHLHSAILTTVLAGSAVSQVNPFVLYPQDPERETITCTSFVGRPDWNGSAEALVKFDRSWLQALGDNSNGAWAHIFGIYHWVADENLSTVESYDLVLRSADTAGGPEMTSPVLRIPGLTTPPSTSTNRGTWIMHDGFGLQGGAVVWVLNSHSLFVGVGLHANPLWPTTDGHSLFRADMLNANTGAALGENHRLGAPNPTWAGLTSAPSFSTPWTYILGPFVVSPNLHMGGIDPSSNRLGAPGANFGMNGIYPDVSGNPRSDGLMMRLTDNLTPFAVVGLAASLGFDGPHQSPFPNLLGFSYVGTGANTISILVSTLQNGVREAPVATPGTIPPALVGTTLAFQGFVWDPNTNLANWSNAQAVHF